MSNESLQHVPQVKEDGGYCVLLEHSEDHEFPAHRLKDCPRKMVFNSTWLAETKEQKDYWDTIPEFKEAYEKLKKKGLDSVMVDSNRFVSREKKTNGDLFSIASIQVCKEGIYLGWPIVDADPDLQLEGAEMAKKEKKIKKLEEDIRKERKRSKTESQKRQRAYRRVTQMKNAVKTVVMLQKQNLDKVKEIRRLSQLQ